MKELFYLAAEKLRYRRSRTLFLFLVLTVSFGFILLSLSLERSMSYTNQEFRFDNYGEWYLAIPNGLKSDGRWLDSQDWAEQAGQMETLGSVQTPGGKIGLGTLDQEMIQVGRLALEDGRWPQAENEIVMEADALLEMGYSACIGQQIQLTIILTTSAGKMEAQQEYQLCGVLREYSDLWTQGRRPQQFLAAGTHTARGCCAVWVRFWQICPRGCSHPPDSTGQVPSHQRGWEISLQCCWKALLELLVP